MSAETSVDTATLAREFGRRFVAEHPELAEVGSPCHDAWLATGGVVWAARVAAMTASATRTAQGHRKRTAGAQAPAGVTLRCGLDRCHKTFRGDFETARQALEDHEIDQHGR